MKRLPEFQVRIGVTTSETPVRRSNVSMDKQELPVRYGRRADTDRGHHNMIFNKRDILKLK